MKESFALIFIPHERRFILVLRTQRMVSGGNSPKFWVKLTLLEQKHQFSVDICS